MMRNAVLFSLFLLASYFTNAQDRPKIGSEKGVKEKILKIKKSFPDFIKNGIAVRDPLYTEEKKYDVKMRMGDGFIMFEGSEDTRQSLAITFSGPIYHSGSMDDFKKYYRQLADMISDIFKGTHTAEEKNTERELYMAFVENGKKSWQSATKITLKMDWLFDHPQIKLVFFTNPSTKAG